MDTSDPDIQFDQNGRCHHCREYEERRVARSQPGKDNTRIMQETVERIRDVGSGKKYDCVCGVSGGVDSTYVAYLAKQLGLRPLAVHFDNGWDSELAVKNIENLTSKLSIDLETYVVDWEEFRDLQLAYMKSGVANLEIPTDHGIWASVYRTAVKHGIKYILAGNNMATEGILPWSWGYSRADLRSLEAIYARFGSRKFSTFPRMGLLRYLYYVHVTGITRFHILDCVDYNKATAKGLITEKLNWRDYGGKHHESRFTAFFQAYWLPRRFGYDKRRAHLSTLVASGQMTRNDAIEEMKSPPCTAEKAREYEAYVCKKFDIEKDDFVALMKMPRKTYRDYPSNPIYWPDILPKVTAVVRSLGLRHH
jgi:N-acetyl sugar amidotransferase